MKDDSTRMFDVMIACVFLTWPKYRDEGRGWSWVSKACLHIGLPDAGKAKDGYQPCEGACHSRFDHILPRYCPNRVSYRGVGTTPGFCGSQQPPQQLPSHRLRGPSPSPTAPASLLHVATNIFFHPSFDPIFIHSINPSSNNGSDAPQPRHHSHDQLHGGAAAAGNVQGDEGMVVVAGFEGIKEKGIEPGQGDGMSDQARVPNHTWLMGTGTTSCSEFCRVSCRSRTSTAFPASNIGLNATMNQPALTPKTCSMKTRRHSQYGYAAA